MSRLRLPTPKGYVLTRQSDLLLLINPDTGWNRNSERAVRRIARALMRRSDNDSRLRIGRKVEVAIVSDEWCGTVTGTVIVKNDAPSTWWILLDEGQPYRDKFGAWLTVKMDDMGNLSPYVSKKAKGK